MTDYHAVVAGTGRWSSLRRWVGVVICGLAVLVVLVPVVGYARVALSGDEVPLPGGRQQVNLPADETWGVYINDANNSGYSVQCTAADVDGRRVPLRDPWFTVSGSDTEMLDFVFDTGSGELTFTCSVPGEEVTLRPVPNLKAVVLRVPGGDLLAVLGLALALNWRVARSPAPFPEPWAAWAGGPAPTAPYPTGGHPYAPYAYLQPRKPPRSGKQVAGVAALVMVLVVALIAAAVFAWRTVTDRIVEEVAGQFPDPGEYYEIPGTDDPALIAAGDRFLGEVDAPPGAVADPYGSTCWVIGVSLCITSESLQPEALLDVTSNRLRDRGADLEKRWCFIDQCYAYLTYEGAPSCSVNGS